MLKHINLLSAIGSGVTTLGYISWLQTLSAVALVVTIVTGILTFGYTAWKWRKEIRNDKIKQDAE